MCWHGGKISARSRSRNGGRGQGRPEQQKQERHGEGIAEAEQLRLEESAECQGDQSAEPGRVKPALPERPLRKSDRVETGRNDRGGNESDNQSAAGNTELQQGLEVTIVPGLVADGTFEAYSKRMPGNRGQGAGPILVSSAEA